MVHDFKYSKPPITINENTHRQSLVMALMDRAREVGMTPQDLMGRKDVQTVSVGSMAVSGGGVGAGTGAGAVAAGARAGKTRPVLPRTSSQSVPVKKPPTGELTGTRTPMPPKADAETRRGINRENESAVILAANGYKVEQNPKVPGSKNPDYKVNGEVFDNYAPSTSRVRNAWSEIKFKVEREQTNRVVVNLTDSPITPAAMKEQLVKYPIAGLKQVIVIDKSIKPTTIDFERK